MIQNKAVTDRRQMLFKEKRKNHGGFSPSLAMGMSIYVCIAEEYFEFDYDFVTIAESFS